MGNPQGAELSFETLGIESGHTELLTMWFQTSCPVTVSCACGVMDFLPFPQLYPLTDFGASEVTPYLGGAWRDTWHVLLAVELTAVAFIMLF